MQRAVLLDHYCHRYQVFLSMRRRKGHRSQKYKVAGLTFVCEIFLLLAIMIISSSDACRSPKYLRVARVQISVARLSVPLFAR